MIPHDHPRYRSLVIRERLAEAARDGVVSLEGLTSHGRGEAFDYLIGEATSPSAHIAERTAAAMIRAARHPVISVNGNTAALAADEIAALQKASGAQVEVNLFHRTEERMKKVTALLLEHDVDVLTGTAERLIPLSHDRAWGLNEGIGSADLVLVPLEDGDRCEALIAMGKQVITVDLNPLSRTARTATLTIVDEVTRALPAVTAALSELTDDEAAGLIRNLDNHYLLQTAISEIATRLMHALD
jgi:4-phosphopantoate--beta-alanine ligase